MKEKSKEARIKEELQRLQVKFALIDSNQREVVAQLIQNAAFMAITLQDLQAEINRAGTVDSYQNGANQHGQKQSATLQAYNSTVKNYAAVIKTLAALVPPERKEERKPWEPEPKTPEQLAAEEEDRRAGSNKAAEEAGQILKWGREVDDLKAAGLPVLSFEEWKAAQGLDA